MRYLVGFLCVCALGLMPLVGCSDDDDSQCVTGPGVVIDDTTCLCTKGGSCAFQCGEDIEEQCTLWCNWYEEIREQPCTLDASHSCKMLCQGAVDCTATCGDDSLIACQGIKSRCEASVGDNADVRCERAELCDLECRGSCWVGCWDGKCTVRCADPEECLVVCSKPQEEATLCPDGRTKVCAMECPAETPTGRDVGAFEVQP